MSEDFNLNGLRKGLTIKLGAMWVLLGVLIVPLTMPSESGLLLATLLPLAIDFVGRCLCADPTPRPWMIGLSIGAQLLGISCLVVCSIMIPHGIVAGALLAVLLQTASARWFVAHLLAIAQSLGRPDLVSELEVLRRNLFRATFASYGTGMISCIVMGAALLFGFMSYGLGLIVTLPLAFLLLLPLWMTCMVFYFLMLYRYQSTLQLFRTAIAALPDGRSSSYAVTDSDH